MVLLSRTHRHIGENVDIRFNTQFIAATAVLLVGSFLTGSAAAQGIALTGVGPINRAMGGAATGAPIDAMGALHWNPAAIGALPASEMSIGLELLLASEELSSQFDANAFGVGLPPANLQGSTSGEPGVNVIPNVGFVHIEDDSPFTFGLGIFAIAGFSTNYPASTTNPILTPQPPNGFGLGRITSMAEILQIVPTVSVRLTDRLYVGAAPTITLARIMATPGLLSPPDDANGDTVPTYGIDNGTRYHWGGGFQVGLFYESESCWDFGVSLKSPQWIEDFRFHSADELGFPVVHKVDFDYPLILSMGLGYRGFADTVIALDVRYFDYKNTDGFGDVGFAPSGAANGLAWDSIWSGGLGVHHHLTECLSLQLGYMFTENPISNTNSSFNVLSPLIVQHIFSVGGSYWIRNNWRVSLAYLHAFESEVSGPLQLPAGTIAGTSVTNSISADALVAGISVRF